MNITKSCGLSDTIVIAGFPGVGKSYVVGADDGGFGLYVFDSDSSGFPKDGFPENYINHIVQTATKVKPHIIMVSSHRVVREALIKAGIHFTLVYPDIKLRGEYIQRYTNRNSPESFLKLLFDNWNAWITECKEQVGCDHIELAAGKYLIDVL